MGRSHVGLRALKANLSGLVARARAGEELVITDRGVPVAKLVPFGADDPLESLIAAGLAERSPTRRRRAVPAAALRLRGRGPSMAEYVAATRR
jgi:prevent-host-death family protein